MLLEYFQAGGPVMYLVLVTWVIVVAGVFDRALYVLGAMSRRPLQEIRLRARVGDEVGARDAFEQERRRASRGVSRIDATSQIATSIGLFGTVLGMATTFLSRSEGGLAMAQPEALADGLSTALFTTVAGLVVFLLGQGFLIAWNEWQESRERTLARILGEGA